MVQSERVNAMQKIDKSKIRGLGKRQILVPYIEKIIRDFDEPWTFTYSSKEEYLAWHPSGDCTPSPIALYEIAKKRKEKAERDPISESLRKSFMVGHYWHQWLQYIVLKKLEFCDEKAIERIGQKTWRTHRVYYGGGGDGFDVPAPFGYVSGAGDIVPIELPKGWKGIVDFKSMGGSTFRDEAMPFADKYECQANIYMDLFDEEKVLIFGINKDSKHEFKEWIFERNQPLIDSIYEKWQYVDDCVYHQTSPEDNHKFPLVLQGPCES